MAALSALIRGDLPPAGNPIFFHASTANAGVRSLVFDGYLPFFVDSGTSALALAMQLAKELRPHIKSPEVILPAYACPDLVAAAEFAGVKPVLADIGRTDPGYDLSRLEEAITENTLLIVAVNFLGMRERLNDIQMLADKHNILVVEDSAQWFPEPYPGADLSADFVLTSFGRGKPVSLLGGGLLLVRQSLGLTPARIETYVIQADKVGWLTLKIKLFNVLLKPRLYCWLNRNPLLSLGETAFHSLGEVKALDNLRRFQIPHCVESYQKLDYAVEKYYDREIGSLCPNAVLPKHCHPGRRRRLLRYPLVCEDRSQRDRLLRSLEGEGLGATAMYKVALPAIKGVGDKVVVRGGLSNAESFAERLITLPTHAGVTEEHLDRIKSVVTASLAL